MLETIDLAIIVLYFMGSLAVGYWASRQITTAEDFSVAGGKLKFPVLLGTLVATTIGASATMGRAGKAYEVGTIIFVAGLAYAAGLYLFSYLAPIIKRMKIWSVPQALHLRYGRNFRLLASVVILVALTGIFIAQLSAFGIIVVTLLPDANISYEKAVIASALIMVVYTALGGLLAVAYTDLVQSVIMVLAIGILLPFIIVVDIGGPAAALSSLVPPDNDWMGGMTVVYLISILLIDIPISLLDVSLWQRTGAAKSIKHIQRAVRIAAVTFIIWSFIVVAMGIFATQLVPDLANTPAGSDAAIPSLAMLYMPPVIKGLCLAALLAVVMSTADTVLLVAGTTVSMDMVSVLKKGIDGKKQIQIARWTIFAIGIIGATIAVSVHGVFEVLLLAFAVYVSALFVPTMLAIFWNKATTAGAITSTLVAFVSVLYLYFEKFNGRLSEVIEPIIVSQTLSLVLMVIVSIATYREGETPKSLLEQTKGAGTA